jgi:hypothetical protein
MTTSVSIAPTTSSTTALLAAGTVSSNGPRHHAGGMPPVVPASELYFWSAKWQSQEREFERDRAANTLLEFDTMDDAIADLMRVDDDEDEN